MCWPISLNLLRGANAGPALTLGSKFLQLFLKPFVKN
jgi:hypothetical protein